LKVIDCDNIPFNLLASITALEISEDKVLVAVFCFAATDKLTICFCKS